MITDPPTDQVLDVVRPRNPHDLALIFARQPDARTARRHRRPVMLIMRQLIAGTPPRDVAYPINVPPADCRCIECRWLHVADLTGAVHRALLDVDRPGLDPDALLALPFAARLLDVPRKHLYRRIARRQLMPRGYVAATGWPLLRRGDLT